MKPLNLRNYIFVNLKQVLPQIILLSIKIALFIFLCSIGFAVVYGLQKDSTQLLNSYSSIQFNKDVSEEKQNEILTKIRDIDGVEKGFVGNAKTEGFGKLIIFNSFCWTFQVDEGSASYILDSIDGKLLSGKLPTNPGEMIISEELSKNIEKGLGDNVGFNEMLENNYKITGIYSGEHNAYIGYLDDEVSKSSYIFKVDNKKIEQFYDVLESYKHEQVGAETITYFEILTDRDIILDIIDNIFNLLKIIGVIILIITAIEVTASVSNLNRVYFTERASEFALLQSVGYSEKFVLKRMLKELSVIILIGLTAGIIIGQVIMVLFYYIYCYDKGIPYQLFESNLILLSILLTVVIFILSYFPVKKYIKKMDWVEVIQQANI